MKKLHTIAFYALTAPVLALGAGSLLAQPAADPNIDYEEQSTEHDQDSGRSSPLVTEGDDSAPRAGQSDSQLGADSRSAADKSDSQLGAEGLATADKSQMENRGFLNAAPANGMQANDLIGAEVKTTGDEEVGPVDDLIVDENGKIVAIVVSVGGFLGLGEKYVAIGWDDVTMTGSADDQELQIDATREELTSAPEFDLQD